MTAVVSAAPAAVARATIAQHSKSFALASKLLTERVRDQTAVVYTYCRRADDAVDGGGDAAGALARLRGELEDVYAGAPRDRVLAAFAVIARDRRIPRRYPEELLSGMAMDVAGQRYETLAQLQLYCHRVAGVVGLMMAHVFGVRDDAALTAAAQLGIAMQLTNICRDVAEDWQRGRLYLPDDRLQQHGVGGLAAELGRPLPAAAVRPIAGVVRDLLALADRQYRAGRRGIGALPWRAGLAVRAAASIYAAIGDRIRERGCDVTARRAIVSRARKLALAVGAGGRAVLAAPRHLVGPAPRIPSRTLEASDVWLA